MLITLRPACSDDYGFALALYLETIKPYASAWISWVDEEQEARFARLWRPKDTLIIVLDNKESVGWLEVSATGQEIFLKQLYVAPAHQRRGIGSHVMRMLLDQSHGTGKPIALGVLKNNPALRLYERLGFSVVGETDVRFLMRREVTERS